MRRLRKRKVLHGKKRTMHQFCKKAKRKVWEIWQDKQKGVSIALMGIGILLMAATEEAVKAETYSLQQGFYWLVVGFAIAYIGAKLLEGVSE